MTRHGAITRKRGLKMSDEAITQTEPINEPQQGEGYNPPPTQEALDRIIENRLKREREKYADYNQLKADSAQLGELVAERDTLRSQIDSMSAELETYKTAEQKRVWAAEVSEETGVPVEALRGETREEMQAHAKTLGKYLTVSAPYVAGDGKTPSSPTASKGEMFNELIKQML